MNNFLNIQLTYFLATIILVFFYFKLYYKSGFKQLKNILLPITFYLLLSFLIPLTCIDDILLSMAIFLLVFIEIFVSLNSCSKKQSFLSELFKNAHLLQMTILITAIYLFHSSSDHKLYLLALPYLSFLVLSSLVDRASGKLLTYKNDMMSICDQRFIETLKFFTHALLWMTLLTHKQLILATFKLSIIILGALLILIIMKALINSRSISSTSQLHFNESIFIVLTFWMVYAAY